MKTLIAIVVLFVVSGYYAFNPPPGRSSADDAADEAREAGMIRLLRRQAASQPEWQCRPYPGYCDIDTDWRPSPDHK